MKFEICKRINGISYSELDCLPMYEFMSIWEKVAEIIKSEKKEHDAHVAEMNQQKANYNKSNLKMPKMPK